MYIYKHIIWICIMNWNVFLKGSYSKISVQSICKCCKSFVDVKVLPCPSLVWLNTHFYWLVYCGEVCAHLLKGQWALSLHSASLKFHFNHQCQLHSSLKHDPNSRLDPIVMPCIVFTSMFWISWQKHVMPHKYGNNLNSFVFNAISMPLEAPQICKAFSITGHIHL